MPDWAARLRLLRPGNAILAAAGTATGILVARSGPVGVEAWLAAPAAAAMLAAFGNVANDRNDVGLDRIAHPRRPLPQGRVTDDEARALQWLLGILGLAAAGLAGPASFLIAGGNVAVLLLYEADLKRRGLPGNAAVAWLTASTFLFGAAATGNPPAAWGLAWLLAGMALLANMAREILKDLQDKDADAAAGQRMTWPMRVPAVTVRLAAFGLVAAAVALSLQAILRPPEGWNRMALGLLAPADGILLLGAMSARRSVPYAQRLLKAGMAVAVVAFAGAAAWAVR